MKILKVLVVIILVLGCMSQRPPTPTCRTSPTPKMMPVSVGQTVRFDLQALFDGYNITFEGPNKEHIQVSPKYDIHQKAWNETMYFQSAKILQHNRFLGLQSYANSTTLSIGHNDESSGVTIEHMMHVEDIPNLHCFDVEQVHDSISEKAYAIIDCAMFVDGKLKHNEFLYVDLESYSLVLGTNQHDTFVHFHMVDRKIQLLVDPFHGIKYLIRFMTAELTDQEHANQTYVQIFMYKDSPLNIKLLQVIDHTVLNLDSLDIADFQLHLNMIYILVKNVGLYQIRLTLDQRVQIRSFMEVKQDIYKFRVQQLGFNDDLLVVFSNDNTVYEYEWDVTNPPSLIAKYSLQSRSLVQQIFVDYDFVIVQSVAVDLFDKRIWVFSRRTTSYTNAFGSFDLSIGGSSIIQWNQHGSTIHIFQEKESLNIKLSLPYLKISPVDSTMQNKTQQILIKATSRQMSQKIECKQTLNIQYLNKFNTEVIKTGFADTKQTYVDAPDEKQVQLQYEFFGPNLNYDITFDINSSIVPYAYIDKIHEATFIFPPEINQSHIVFFEMFTELNFEEREPQSVYGIVQVQNKSSTIGQYQTHYIHCKINVLDRDGTHHLNCRIVHSSEFTKGKIVRLSQLYDPHERRIACIFSTEPQTVYVYYFYSFGFAYYGKKKFSHEFANTLTDIQINKGQLIASFQYGKRLEIYKLEDLYEPDEKEANAKPIMVIDHNVMAFFGIKYFAPIDLKVSIHHDEVVFVRTKTGIMAMNINENGLPQLLFHFKTNSSIYNFEVNRDTLVLITQNEMSLWRLQTPLRRRAQPFLLQNFQGKYTLNEYSQINSDGFFYLVTDDAISVIHPNRLSTSILYHYHPYKNAHMIDAVRMEGQKEILFAFDGQAMSAWVLSEQAKLYVEWVPKQRNFTLNISAHNNHSKSDDSYSTKFNVIESNEEQIKPSKSFNATKVRKLGNVEVDVNVPSIDLNITLNDSDWFTGNVLFYNYSCKDCHQNDSHIHLQNHVAEVGDIVASRAIYDMESTHNGIFVQQYDAVFKTFKHNDSIQYTFRIPTQTLGQPCTKIGIPVSHDYLLHFCERGTHVNVYMTTLSSFKPFTSGPYETGAKAVNHVKIVGDVVMLIDNDDNPYTRAGGVYLYLISTDHELEEPLRFLDFLDYADLQFEQFTGVPYIASADIHKPLFNKEEYNIFITEGRTGSIFVFTFEISKDRNEIVYLHKKMIPLKSLIPDSVHHPQPLRVMTINIVDYTVKTDSSERITIQYFFLLTVKNWHHIEIMITLDMEDKVLFFELTRLFQRVPYPAALQNYVKIKKGALNSSYFAVSYIDQDKQAQAMVVYELPFFNVNETKSNHYMVDGIPVTKALGAHGVRDIYQISFAFHALDNHKLLFVDTDGINITEIQINRELKLVIKDVNPQKQQPQNITLTAMNHYTNYSFKVQLSFEGSKEGERLQIIWIVILIVGFIMIVGLVIVWVRQSKGQKRDQEGRQSLLTNENAGNINRSTVNQSLRGTFDETEAKQNKMKLDKESEEEGKDQSQEEAEEEAEQEGQGQQEQKQEEMENKEKKENDDDPIEEEPVKQ